MTILGEAALSDIDLIYAKFADEFEKEYVSQGYDANRSIDETMDIEKLETLLNHFLSQVKEN